MRKTIILVTMILTTFTFYGCGDESSTISNDDYQIALYQAYSTTKPLDPMNDVAINALYLFIADIQNSLTNYIIYCTEHGQSPASYISLSNPPAGFIPPVNVTGSITTTGGFPPTTLDGQFELNGYGDTAQVRSYSGKINVSADTFNITTQFFNKMTITVPTLDINYSDPVRKYKKVSYLSYSVGIDNSSTNTIYSLSGEFSVDNSSYGYKSYTFQNNSLVFTLSGQVIEGGFRFSVTGSPTSDSAGVWVSGSLTLGYIEGDDDTVTTQCAVTLSSTSANFTITDGDQWDLSNWFNLQLTP
jgi:hypothetical protein